MILNFFIQMYAHKINIYITFLMVTVCAEIVFNIWNSWLGFTAY